MKNLLLSIRTLPLKFVDEQTRVTEFKEDTVIAAHPSYQPMIWERSTKKWKLLKTYHIDVWKDKKPPRSSGSR